MATATAPRQPKRQREDASTSYLFNDILINPAEYDDEWLAGRSFVSVEYGSGDADTTKACDTKRRRLKVASGAPVRRTVLETATFAASLRALSREDRRSEAIDLALDYLDDLLISARSDECDMVLSLISPRDLASSISVSILGITRKVNDLPARRRFFDAAFSHIAQLKGRKYAAELLNKYR